MREDTSAPRQTPAPAAPLAPGAAPPAPETALAKAAAPEASDDEAPPSPAATPPPDFASIAAALESSVGKQEELSIQLLSIFEQVDWFNPEQLDTMTGILGRMYRQHPSARELIDGYLASEAAVRAAHSGDDPRPGRALVDAYFAVVDDTRMRRAMLSQLDFRLEDPSQKAYYREIDRKLASTQPPEESEASARPRDDNSP